MTSFPNLHKANIANFIPSPNVPISSELFCSSFEPPSKKSAKNNSPLFEIDNSLRYLLYLISPTFLRSSFLKKS